MYKKTIIAYKSNNLKFICNLVFRDNQTLDKDVEKIYKKITKFIADGLEKKIFYKFEEIIEEIEE